MSETTPPSVACETGENGVAVITIQRPEKLNALNLEVKRLIEENVRRLTVDNTVSVIVLTGGPKVFVAGTDIAEMQGMTPTQHLLDKTDGVFVALRECPKTLIAAVEGYALGGGCELALACDLIIAGDGAKFGQPEIRVGIMPGAGGSQLLLRTIGKYRTMLLALTGEQIGAAEALTIGIASEVVPEGEALSRALERAKTISRMPPLAVRAIKQAIQLGQETPLSAALAAERNHFRLLFDSADQKEGMQAFMDKRTPIYTGS